MASSKSRPAETAGSTVAFISGGNRGIGLATAEGLARQGMTVIIGARNVESGLQAAEEFRKRGLKVETVPYDVTSAADRDRAAEYIDDRCGHLDVLVNNAGVMLESGESPFNKPNTASIVSEQILRETFEVNFFGLVAATQRFLPLLKKAPHASIVNVSSILGSVSIHATSNDPRLPNHRQIAYNASKAAVNLFTIHLAHELSGTSIKVNSAHPGWVRSDMGGPTAEMSLEQGAETSIRLALLPPDGPTGGFVHGPNPLPW